MAMTVTGMSLSASDKRATASTHAFRTLSLESLSSSYTFCVADCTVDFNSPRLASTAHFDSSAPTNRTFSFTTCNPSSISLITLYISTTPALLASSEAVKIANACQFGLNSLFQYTRGFRVLRELLIDREMRRDFSFEYGPMAPDCILKDNSSRIARFGLLAQLEPLPLELRIFSCAVATTPSSFETLATDDCYPFCNRATSTCNHWV